MHVEFLPYRLLALRLDKFQIRLQHTHPPPVEPIFSDHSNQVDSSYEV